MSKGKQEEIEVEDDDDEELEQDEEEEQPMSEDEDEDDDPIGDVTAEFVQSLRAANFTPRFNPKVEANWEAFFHDVEQVVQKHFY